MDVNAFMRHAAPTREPDRLMPRELQAAAGLDPVMIDGLFADQAAKIKAAEADEKRRREERQRLAAAVGQIFDTEPGKVLKTYLQGMLTEKTYLVLQGLSNEQVVQLGAFKEGCNATAALILELEREAKS